MWTYMSSTYKLWWFFFRCETDLLHNTITPEFRKKLSFAPKIMKFILVSVSKYFTDIMKNTLNYKVNICVLFITTR